MDNVIVTSAGSARMRPRLRAAPFMPRNGQKKSAANRNCGIHGKNWRSFAGRTPRNGLNGSKHARHAKNPPKNIIGKFTREVHNIVSRRLGNFGHTPPYIPHNSVKELFNDLHLYPTTAQVSAMIQVARQVSKRKAPVLSFEELCFYIRLMQNSKASLNQQVYIKADKCTNNCEVFLGGSCNPTTWRTDVAIPELIQHGISFYNPQVSTWLPELVAKEHDAKQSAALLLYVVDSQTRSVAGMIEVAYLVAAKRCVVLVAYPYEDGQSIMDEPITHKEYVDLVNAQTSLLALVKSQGISVHSNLSNALQSTVNILRNTNLNNGMTAEQQVAHKLRKLKETFDFFDKNRMGEINLEDVLDAYRRLTNKSIDMRSAYNYLSSNEDANMKRISFEQFCALVAEFSTDDCELFTSDDWISNLLNTSTNNNAHKEENYIENKAVNGTSHNNYIYLGGSCRTTWRNEVIPILNQQGIKYYNPAIRENACRNNINAILNGFTFSDNCVCDRNIFQWKEVMEKSAVLFFHITNDTRSFTTMILAAHYIGLKRNVVLCIQQMPHEDLLIDNEKLTKQAIKDYNRGRVYLQDLAKRKDVPVFDNVKDAVQCAIERYRSR